jgi:hypothetical protein
MELDFTSALVIGVVLYFIFSIIALVSTEASHRKDRREDEKDGDSQ